MKKNETPLHNKFNEIKHHYNITKFKSNQSKIQSLMLLSNPYVSSQIKSKYSSLISNAVCSFLDHNPKERDISNHLHYSQMISNSTNRKLVNTKEFIFNLINNSTRERKCQPNLTKFNTNYLHGPNPFDNLTIKSTKANYSKTIHRSSSSDNTLTLMKRIKDFTSTINRPTAAAAAIVNMPNTVKQISLKKDNNDLIKKSVINSSSVQELNTGMKISCCVIKSENGGKGIIAKEVKEEDSIIQIIKERIKQKEDNKEQYDSISICSDIPFTDRLNSNYSNKMIHLSSIIKDNSSNEGDTFSTFKSYLLLNSPNS